MYTSKGWTGLELCSIFLSRLYFTKEFCLIGFVFTKEFCLIGFYQRVLFNGFYQGFLPRVFTKEFYLIGFYQRVLFNKFFGNFLISFLTPGLQILKGR